MFAAVGSGLVLWKCYSQDYRKSGPGVAGVSCSAVCHSGREMTGSQSVAGRGAGEGVLVLGVDTCGPSGTVALARVGAGGIELLGQTELAGKTYSATLVSAVEGLLTGHGVKLADIGA